MSSASQLGAPPLPPRLRGRLRRRDGVVGAVAPGDATVLMDVTKGRYYTLNAVGGRIWELLGSGPTFADLVADLLEEYEVASDRLHADLVTILEQLDKAGLIVCE